MIYPTFSELTKDQFNRSQLAIATAKCARIITDEYVQQREEAEKAQAGSKDADSSLRTAVDKELRDEKAVKLAINRIHKGEYEIVELEETEETETEESSDETEE